MKGINLNKLHRYVGIIIAPFLVIQTLTGLMLSFGPLRLSGSELLERHLPVLHGWWNGIVTAHFGPGIMDDGYHVVLGAGIFWMAFSGWILYLRGRRLRKKMKKSTTAEKSGGGSH
ncbi:MAG TPA: hypothetical protein VN642_06095 [Dongiaceae bacterium]|nr:hypothetical protein [Dongiaceae bacterium]